VRVDMAKNTSKINSTPCSTMRSSECQSECALVGIPAAEHPENECCAVESRMGVRLGESLPTAS
jgi:hypothetical protein